MPITPIPVVNISHLHDMCTVKEDSIVEGPIHLKSSFPLQIFDAAEDLFQVMISVIFIAVLWQIAQATFLRPRHRHGTDPSLRDVHRGYLFDEYPHFRNVWTFGNTRAQRAPRSYFAFPPLGQSSVFTRLLVFLFVFAPNVAKLCITQPPDANPQNSNIEYNLYGEQFVGTLPNFTRQFWSISSYHPFVSPSTNFEDQKHQFAVDSCNIYTEKRALDADEDRSDEITLGSWYHTAGSDHNISSGEVQHTIRIRAEVFLVDGGRAVKRIMFNQTENQLQHARCLHDVIIHAAMEWSCRQPFSRVDCDTLAAELVRVRSRPVRKLISLWKGHRETIKHLVTGIETTYRIRMNAPLRALSEGICILAAGSAIYEVQE